MCCKKRKIGHELRTLDNMMSRNLMAAARERGVDELTAMHGWILGYLCRNEDKDIFQKDIEAEFKICRSTVTNILKLMEKKGYIRRASEETGADRYRKRASREDERYDRYSGRTDGCGNFKRRS